MDKIIYCTKCEKPFILTAGQQYTYQYKKFPLPKRCAQCLIKRRNDRMEEVNRQRKRLCDRMGVDSF